MVQKKYKTKNYIEKLEKYLKNLVLSGKAKTLMRLAESQLNYRKNLPGSKRILSSVSQKVQTG